MKHLRIHWIIVIIVSKDQKNIQKIITTKHKKFTNWNEELSKDPVAKVDASLRRFNSVIELVNALSTFDRNRRSGDSLYINVHDSQKENLVTVMTSTIGFEERLFWTQAPKTFRWEKEGRGWISTSITKIPGRGGRVLNPARFASEQRYSCGVC